MKIEYEKFGVHQPTEEFPYLFTYPNSNECRLIARKTETNAHGCPIHPGCSCSHGLDGFVCEHGIAPV